MRRGDHRSRVDQRTRAQAQASAGLRGIGEECNLLADAIDPGRKNLRAVRVIGTCRGGTWAGSNRVIGYYLEIGSLDGIDGQANLRARRRGGEYGQRGRGKQQCAAINQSN